MNRTELFQNVHFVLDADGNKTALLLAYATWEQVMTILEDIEESEEISRSRATGEEAIPWEQAKAELQFDDKPRRP